MEQETPHGWVSVTVAAKASGYTHRRVQQLASQGRIRSKPFGERSIQVYYPDIEKWQRKLAAQQNGRSSRYQASHDDGSSLAAEDTPPYQTEAGHDDP